MKKFAFLFALMSFTLAASADVPVTTGTAKRTFYGEKARNSIKNPCKGALVSICGVIETPIVNGLGYNASSLTNSGLEDGGESAVSSTSSESIVIWRVPADISDNDYQEIKANEMLYSNLRVVKGLPESDESDDVTTEY